MKKKIYKFVSVAVIAVVMVVSVQMNNADGLNTLLMGDIAMATKTDVTIGEPCLTDLDGVCIWMDDEIVDYWCDGQFYDGSYISWL